MKQYPQQIIANAINFRIKGFTYKEICDQLDLIIPKSTLSSWFKNISLPLDYYNRMKMSKYTNIKSAQAQNKILLNTRLNRLKTKNDNIIRLINLDIGKIILSMLYWCEGAKYPSHRGIRFGSSDPEMIRLFIVLLRTCFLLDEDKFRLTIQCRADQNTQALTVFWQNITDIPRSQTYAPQVDKRSIGIPTHKLSYKGVCVIEYLDTNLQCELQFLGKYLGSIESTTIMKNQIK